MKQNFEQEIIRIRQEMTAECFYERMGVSPALWKTGEEILDGLKNRFAGIDETAQVNQLKVLGAMQKNRVSIDYFNGSTGYGYSDAGRDVLEKVYADVGCA